MCKRYVRRDNAPQKFCPHCGTEMDKNIVIYAYAKRVIYECPKGCHLSFEESFFSGDNVEIYYEEEECVNV